jgi:nucleotide-binding universal stress UspA family protein
VILVCYDGSADAKAAIARAGELFAGRKTLVLNVWEPIMEVMTRTPASFGLLAGIPDVEELDAKTEAGAQRTAEEGAQLAREAGLDASARLRARSGSIAQAIIAEADSSGCNAIVIGSRGLSGLGSLLLGSVSHALVQHADRAVLVVPSADVAKRRSEQLQRRDHAAHSGE